VSSITELVAALALASHTILIADGVYPLTTTLSVARNVTLQAEAAGRVVLDGQGQVAPVTVDIRFVTVRLHGLTLINGHAYNGGCVHITGATVIISNSTISGCAATNYGGGVYAGGSATLSVTDSTITGCTSQRLGGGVFAVFSIVMISSSTVSNCTAPFEGSGSTEGGQGGGICLSWGSTGTLSQTAITDCTATLYGGGIFMSNRAGLSMSTSSIRGCSAQSGGGIWQNELQLQNVAVHLDGLIFESNSASFAQAIGLAAPSASSTIANTIFSGHNPAASIIHVGARVTWICALGTFMPPTGTFFLDFNSSVACARNCSAGFYATLRNHTTKTCGDRECVGHYCPEATVTPIPCPSGTYQPERGARTQGSCIPVAPSDV
jgi:hypothetical protein